MTRFDAARRRAFVRDLLAAVARRPADLLPFDAVREGLRLRHTVDRGLEEVPLDRIVGTLDRGLEFNRAFLPRDESLRGRWQEVEELAVGPAGFPPVELYQVGHAYFVVDGHHRVSVLRTLGSRSVEARVWEFLSPLPLEPGARLEEVLLQRGLADFLEATGLDPAHAAEYRVTVAGGYGRLLDHIAVHRYYRGIETGAAVRWEDAVASWRDTVFRPVVTVVCDSGVLAEFPGRTAADVYLFAMDHLHFLRERYGHREVAATAAVRHLAALTRARRGLVARLRRWWRAARRRGGETGCGEGDDR